ncbi:glycosyltransferase family 2 protein [Flavitalea flava]
MVLSVIIVNYQVKYFLEQCLYSVQKAIQIADIQGEIFVVDNFSRDGSLEYLRPGFPEIHFLANQENIGFSRANNQALGMAKGSYIIFLNPDTILPEDIFSTCISFLEANPNAGAAGVRMVDGSGRYLKESKRGFPSPWAAFCKMSGLTRLFPDSRWLAKYYEGHLPENQNNPVAVLSGAFLFAKRQVLEKTGGFDEQFFMYAEDIDLSYRITREGFINYYIADTTILHFKGESTPKDSHRIKLFYKAMSQFRRKHFSGGLPLFFNTLLEIAIRATGAWRAILNKIKRGWSPEWLNHRLSGNEAGAVPCLTWIGGDPEAAERMRGALKAAGNSAGNSAAKNRSMATEKEKANEYIFCEGKDFSFKDCLIALEQAPAGVSLKVHASGSFSAVGSRSKDGLGEIVVL